MPIRVRYHGDGKDCTIRPTPFIQISENVLKNKEGNFGVTYSITLTGTLLPDEGTPYALNPATNQPFDFLSSDDPVGGIGPYNLFDEVPLSQRSRPPRQQVQNKSASAILSKQRALRALFAKDGQRVELSDIFDNAGATIVCYPRVISVDFTEGQYISKCEYTITLEADYLIRENTGDDEDGYVDLEGTYVNRDGSLISSTTPISGLLLDDNSFFLESYSEDWGLEVDDSLGESVENPRSYRISHNLSAVGKTVYDYNGDITKPAWQQAKDFVLSRLSENPSGNYPNIAGQIGSGTVNLIDSYGGYNHVRTEQIDVVGGSYSVTENWLLASGLATETYNMSVSTSNSEPFISVSIDGAIKGVSKIPPDQYGNKALVDASGAYANALSKYNEVSNNGKFGINSDIYKRANNIVAVQLNSQPVSTSLSANQYNGEISYNLSFDNRPTNIISGVLAESIQVNDTYPGDVFATIPVLGRKNGPILQYLGGRTEYRRDVSINLTMDYTKIPYGGTRESLILKKPSLVEPTASQIAVLLSELSPQGEPGVRKYFISPPSESWSPKEGSYSFNISFTYELDK